MTRTIGRAWMRKIAKNWLSWAWTIQALAWTLHLNGGHTFYFWLNIFKSCSWFSFCLSSVLWQCRLVGRPPAKKLLLQKHAVVKVSGWGYSTNYHVVRRVLACPMRLLNAQDKDDWWLWFNGLENQWSNQLPVKQAHEVNCNNNNNEDNV